MNNLNTNNNGINKYVVYLIGFLVLVIIGLIVFGGNNDDNNNKELENQIAKLKEDAITHRKKADSLELLARSYMEENKEFRRRDSLNSIESEKQRKITAELKRQQEIARKERERVERELSEFKNNLPKYDESNPTYLLFDTRKKLN